MSTSYSEYVPTWERPVITALCKLLLSMDCTLAVHDGEEWASKRTRKLTTLRPAFGSTGKDRLVVWGADGERLGSFLLIYNNGSEHDPMVVIADYGWSGDAAGDMFDGVWQELSATYG